MTLDEIMKMEEHQATAQLRGASKSSAIADLPLALADDASEAIRAIKESSTQSGIFFLDPKSEILKVEIVGKFAIDDIARRMPANEPRYAILRYPHEYESKAASPIVFLYYCPDIAAPRSKMTYSSCKSIAVKYCEKLGLIITKQFEFSEVGELSGQALLQELYPKATEKKVFAKPKKPGKGQAKLTAGTKFESTN